MASTSVSTPAPQSSGRPQAEPRPSSCLRAETGSVRYIGSKARVVDEILAIVGPRKDGDGFFVDAFCGTGAVGARASEHGWPVRFNDNLLSAVVVSTARLLSPSDVPFIALGGYSSAVAELNVLDPVKGFFWREYSPAGAAGRRYFTPENAARIDAARAQIKEWWSNGLLGADEHALLLADLIGSAARVASIAGTYGCFLNRWTTASQRPLAVKPRELRDQAVAHEAFSGDVTDTPVDDNDVVYYDPPYTKRQYAAYYHVNETLACEDEPTVVGKTGLRPWHEKASDYCYKSRALGALTALIEGTPACRVLLSYSSEGHVDLADLEASLAPMGDLTVHELGPIGRYRPNSAASAASAEVEEYVLDLAKAANLKPEATGTR